MDYGAIITTLAGGSALTVAGQSVAAFFKARSDKHAAITTAANTIDMHRDKLTFDLLQAAREEVAAARAEAIELRQVQSRLRHFDEALEHIAALLEAARDGLALDLAERHARAFLARMEMQKEPTP